jgi:hypothetical protein
MRLRFARFEELLTDTKNSLKCVVWGGRERGWASGTFETDENTNQG